MNGGAVVIMTTVRGESEADALAALLVETRAAACVQAMPIRSHYRWEGMVERASEILLLVKTAADRTESVVEAIRAGHGYTLPEILVLPVSGGLEAYLQWIGDETHPDPASPPPSS